MNQFFKELFEYSHHMNQQLGDVFNENPDKTSERAINLYNHILNAHHIWNHRIQSKQADFGVWGVLPIKDCKKIDRENFEQSLFILDTYDLDTVVNYKNFKGEPFINNVRDILFHVINHSTYHRAQIATDFKQSGLGPLISDYIFYKR